MKPICGRLEIYSVLCAISIVILAMFLIDFKELSFANNIIPCILITLSLLTIILAIVIKPMKDKNRQILILNGLECLSLVYSVFYVIFIIAEPKELIGYLKLIPVACAFAFAEMTKKNIRKNKSNS